MNEIDESFLPFHEMLSAMTDLDGEHFTDDRSIHTYIYSYEVGTPIELDIIIDESGKVKLGMVPPMYRVETSFRPSYHSVTFTAIKHEP